MTEELTNIQTQLAAQQQQIADAQQRLTALEAGRGPQAGGDLMGLLTTAAGIASRFARTAAEAHATQEKPAEEPPRRERRAGGLAAKLAELREDRAAEQQPRSLSFPIEDRSGFRTDPAATYAGRTAPRRTLPPEAPLRLWNRDYTDKLDVIGRAASGGLDGVQRIRIRDDQADDARAWIAERFEADENVHVAWMDRPWSVAEYYAAGRRGGLTLRLEPIPKPPRVDQVLGRAPYAGPFPDLAAGDRIGVEHPDGTITTHEFSGDPAHPVAGDGAAHLGAKLSAMRGALSAALDEAPEEYKLPDGVGLGTVPEYGQPVGTVTSGLIHATPEPCGFRHGAARCGLSSGHDGLHNMSCPDEPDVDEVLPMPGGPNDRLSHGAQAASDVAHSAEWLREHPTAMHPETAQTIARHGYGDLYARLDDIHDATDDGEDQ